MRKVSATLNEGEKLSRMSFLLSGSIQIGREAWSGFKATEEKSLAPNRVGLDSDL